MIPAMASLINSYVKKEYTEIPLSSVIAIISSLIYFINPFDLIPDSIISFGQIDDTAIILYCLRLVGNDINKYNVWREQKNNVI